MQDRTLRALVGTLIGAGALIVAPVLTSGVAFAQTPSQPPPPTKQPQLPSTKPVDPTPATPSAGKSRERASETTRGADASFVAQAAEGGSLEVELGRIALQRAAHVDVKTFAQRMIDDHTKGDTELRALAERKQITVPDAASVKARHRALIARLEKLSGAEFDKAYIHDMVEDHVKDIRLFEREAAKGTDADVQAFAKDTLPTLRAHLEQARDVQARLTKGTE